MLVRRIARHILDTRYENLPHGVIHAAKLRLIDALSCTVGGHVSPSNAIYLNLFKSWGGAPQASVLGFGEKLPLPQAALINCLSTRSFDFEVTGPEAEGINKGKMVGHVCSTTDPTALSVAEFMNSSGQELLVAVVLGGDVGARLAVSEEFNFDKCFEVCGTANAIGALAVVARLMKLDEDQIVNAFGILLHMMSGSYQSLWDGADTFKLPGALAAYNAVTAAQLSLGSFGGVKDALTSKLGYYNLYSYNASPENFAADLGTTFYVQGMHKLHPSCYGNHNPIECALELVNAHHFTADDVETITVDVPPHRVNHFLNQTMSAEDGQARALFSIPYGIANALVNKEVRIEHYTSAHIHDPIVMALTERVVLQAAEDVNINQLMRLAIHLKDGRVLKSERDKLPLGWAANPVSDQDIVNKFWRNIHFAKNVSDERAQRALEAIQNLEQLDSVVAITDNLR
ncbi:MmgE/PrpD family protein [Pseudomonas sp. MPC6]|uniref:MmgE/PrpD family protein n=1 Tax=unclassified Pseudomonas TaxID=196821 RepID=UPI001110265C|nr:MmgE/PrpD family protein [Pseudomonas sp. MPC6]QCY14744.1 MmgE/PrpD family protein [Pseudomonas sp. MPC6]